MQHPTAHGVEKLTCPDCDAQDHFLLGGEYAICEECGTEFEIKAENWKPVE